MFWDHSRVPVCNHPIQPNFVKIRRFELQHFVNTFASNLREVARSVELHTVGESITYDIGGLADLIGGTICPTEFTVDKLLTEFIE